jgi:Skp family chaperone for outer membrane proteins
MDKTVLINQLKELRTLIEKKEAIESLKQGGRFKLFRTANVLIMIFVALLIIYAITRIPNLYAAIVIVATVMLFGIIFFLRNVANKQENEHASSDELNDISDKIHTINIVPEYYKTTSALEDFISYLMDGRANSVEDCIKMYEISDRLLTLEKKEKVQTEREKELNQRENDISLMEANIEPLHREAESKLRNVEQREQLLNFNHGLLNELKETNCNFNSYNETLKENTTHLKELNAQVLEKRLDEIIRNLEHLKWENEKRFDDYSKKQMRMFEEFRRDILA